MKQPVTMLAMSAREIHPYDKPLVKVTLLDELEVMWRHVEERVER